MGDIAARLVIGFFGVLLVHDAVWFNEGWLYGRYLGTWARRYRSETQILFRLSMGAFGILALFAAVFGTVVHPK